MRNIGFLFPALAGLSTAIVTTWILLERRSSLPPAPVGVTFVGSDEFNNSGAARSGPIFWVTNHTSKGLCVRPWTVEIREGTNWTKWDYHGPPVFIGPHAAAYETIDF